MSHKCHDEEMAVRPTVKQSFNVSEIVLAASCVLNVAYYVYMLDCIFDMGGLYL